MNEEIQKNIILSYVQRGEIDKLSLMGAYLDRNNIIYHPIQKDGSFSVKAKVFGKVTEKLQFGGNMPMPPMDPGASAPPPMDMGGQGGLTPPAAPPAAPSNIPNPNQTQPGQTPPVAYKLPEAIQEALNEYIRTGEKAIGNMILELLIKYFGNTAQKDLTDIKSKLKN